MSNADVVRTMFEAYLAQDADTGEPHRNTEFITVRNGQLIETQAFFGGRV